MDMMNKNVKVVNGKFKEFEGVVVGDCKLAEKWLIKLDEFNAIYADKKDVVEGDIEKIVEIDGEKFNFKTRDEYIIRTKEDWGLSIRTKMFDIKDKRKSLDIAINEYKIKVFKNKIHILQQENAELQGLKII